MALSVRFRKLPNSGVQRQLKVVSENRPGEFKPLETFNATDLLEVKPGARGWVPVGVDTRTPGFSRTK